MRATTRWVLSILFSLEAASAFAQSGADPAACARVLSAEAEALKIRQNAAAHEFGGVSRLMASRLYRPRAGAENGKAALVVHGFMASPFEVETLAERLAADGYVVWSPLIYGFGAMAALANRTSIDEFRRSVDDGMDLLALCHSEIAIAGFSFGGSLVTDFLFRGVDLDGAYVSSAHPERKARVAAAAALAPYYSTWVQDARALEFVRKSAAWKPELPLWMVALTSSDVRAARLYPRFYLSEMPLRAVVTLLDFASRFAEIAASGQRSRVPMTLAFSAGDRTVDWPMAERYVPQRFERADVVKIPALQGVPHQILLPALNPAWRATVEAIARRLERPETIGAVPLEIVSQK